QGGIDKTVIGCTGIDGRRNHAGRQAEFAVTGGVEKIQLSVALAHQYIGTGDIGTTCEIETDKRNLACAVKTDAAGVYDTLFDGQTLGLAWQAKDGTAKHRRHAPVETLGDKIAAGLRPAMIAVAQGFVQAKKRSALSHGALPLLKLTYS